MSKNKSATTEKSKAITVLYENFLKKLILLERQQDGILKKYQKLVDKHIHEPAKHQYQLKVEKKAAPSKRKTR